MPEASSGVRSTPYLLGTLLHQVPRYLGTAGVLRTPYSISVPLRPAALTTDANGVRISRIPTARARRVHRSACTTFSFFTGLSLHHM